MLDNHPNVQKEEEEYLPLTEAYRLNNTKEERLPPIPGRKHEKNADLQI
jgi:hypothetical protein